MKTKQAKTIFILTHEESEAFYKIESIIGEMCSKQLKDKTKPCKECPFSMICYSNNLFDNMKEFFDCYIERE